MDRIHIQFSLFSAFYTPLIAVMTGDHLAREGLAANWSVSPPGVSAIEALKNGEAQVIQSAPSQAFLALNRGEQPPALHFAQINEMDGFFLTAARPDPDFTWEKLEGARVILFGGGQPLAMFRYACHKAGIDFDRIEAVHVGGPEEMDRAFRDGKGAYVQQQGPYPQELAFEGRGHVVAQVGPQIGPCAFSSLAATPDWLATDQARAFTRAYAAARAWTIATPAVQITRHISEFFPGVETTALAHCIAAYQRLGCWTPHLDITQAALDVAMDVFAHSGALHARPAWDQVCAPPPA